MFVVLSFWSAQNYMTRVEQQLRTSIDERINASNELMAFKQSFFRIEHSVNRYIIEPNDKHKQQIYLLFSDPVIYRTKALTSNWFSHDSQKKSLETLQIELINLYTTLELIFTRNATDKELFKSPALLEQTTDAHFAAVNHQISDIENSLVASQKDQIAIFSTSSKKVQLYLIVLSVLGVVSLVIGFIYFERKVLKPLSDLADTVNSDQLHQRLDALSFSKNIETQVVVDSFTKLQEHLLKRQNELEYIANHDPLTQLPNRYALIQYLGSILAKNKSDDHKVLVLIELNRLNTINNALGYSVGDDVIKSSAQRIKAFLKDDTYLAHVTGNSFALTFINTTIGNIVGTIQGIIRSIEVPFYIHENPIYIGANSGVVFMNNRSEPEQLLRDVNTASSEARIRQFDYVIYKSEHHQENLRKISIANELRKAIENESLEIHYQPQVNLDGRFRGFESLLRWDHPTMGSIAPDDFIELAEQTGIIHSLTRYVINKVFDDCALLNQNGLNYECACINISAENLHHPNFIANVLKLIKKHSIDPSTILFEITESAMMREFETAIDVLQQVKQIGIKLAIDDFGTGFSSLSYLKQLPVDKLKIDKSFILEMINHDNDAVIVESTIHMAHSLGIQVIAEGVENPSSLALLKKYQCDLAQGNYFSHAINFQVLSNLLKNHNSLRLPVNSSTNIVSLPLIS